MFGRSVIFFLVFFLTLNVSGEEDKESRTNKRFQDGLDKLKEKFSKEKRLEKADDAYVGWNSVVGDIGHEIDLLTKQEDLALFLFQELGASQGENFGLYSETFDAPSVMSELPVTAGISMNLNRKVIDNRNVRRTYSVVDRMTFNISPSIYAKFVGVPFFTAHFGGGPRFSFEVFNIRHVSSEKYSTILPLKKVKDFYLHKIKKEKAKKTFTNEKGNTVGNKNEKYLNFMPRLSKYMPQKNAIREAYLGKLWNPISQAFRLPITLKSVNRMAKNEIISYALSGGIVLGASFGTSLDPTGYLSILRVHGADISFSISGKHQISVLKEAPQKKNDNFVRLKLTRLRSIGGTFGMGSSAVTPLHKWITLDGNIVWSTLGGIVQLKPYRFQVSKSHVNFYDIAYRFNLNIMQGRDAYLMASRGDMTLADTYSSESYFKSIGKNESKRPVKRLFTKKQKSKNRSVQKMIRLFLLELDRSNTFNDTYKWIKIDGVIHKYFETDVISKRNLKILFAFNKNRSHRFTINSNLNTFNKKSKPEDSLTLLVRASYRDDFIPAKRYVRYVNEIEMALDKKEFLPLPPTISGKDRFLKGSLGKLNLSYSLKVKRKALYKLIKYPEEKMWPVLIKAFGAEGKGWDTKKGRAKWVAARLAVYGLTIPVTALGTRLPEKDDIIVAMIKYSRWKKLKILPDDPETISNALGKFFESGDYGPEMVRILRMVLVNQEVGIKGSFVSDLLGDGKGLSVGETTAWSDPTAESVSRSFDNYRPNFKGIYTSGVNAKVIGQGYLKINFNLEKVPKKVFFNLELKNLTGILTNRSLKTLVVENEKKRFVKGLNSIVFFLNDKKHFLYPLGEKIKFYKFGFIGNKYRISVAATEDGIHYGDVSSYYFRAKPVYHRTKLKSLKKWSGIKTRNCMGKTADELILYLDRKNLEDHIICSRIGRRDEDGRCIKGIAPYVKIIGMKKENRERRNKWIIDNCPMVMDEEDLKRLTDKKDYCQNKKASEIIKIIGKDIFYICDYWNTKKSEEGFCRDGVIPYMYDESLGFKHSENIKERNNWLEKNCL